MRNTNITSYRWTICAMLFFATTVNYLDRQVLSLTWNDFIKPEFLWTDTDYGTITGLFSLVYAFAMLFAGKFVDWLDTKKGYLWAIGIWSVGACMHAFCGIITSGVVVGEWALSFEAARTAIAGVEAATRIVEVSVICFIFARIVLAVGEAGNFPAAIKATAEYFPKKDRAFATSIFNAGATVGALLAPVSIPLIAKYWGWEMAFISIGALGFIWIGFWIFIYKKPDANPKVNAAELSYILQDKASTTLNHHSPSEIEAKIPFLKTFTYKQTWAFALGKFFTDGVWWFFLFWTPAYLSDVYGIKSSDPIGMLCIFTLYAITLLSIYGGKLPTIIINRTGKNPYAARMQAMLIFAFFPLLALFAQPLGAYSYWFPVVIIGIAGAAHQSWSANIFSVVGDMFPKSAIATVTGIGGMAGGVSSFLINKSSGKLFDYADTTQMQILGFEGKSAGYFIIFCICSVAYLIGWTIMKALVPKYKMVEV
ncbi:MAG: MFS transporter [Prevotellaceae bacterium]|jgi:ACS family hexuronate transporter-like MFS transporter|nr:MFS transporter [Prevotellaceae bacterium]